MSIRRCANRRISFIESIGAAATRRACKQVESILSPPTRAANSRLPFSGVAQIRLFTGGANVWRSSIGMVACILFMMASLALTGCHTVKTSEAGGSSGVHAGDGGANSSVSVPTAGSSADSNTGAASSLNSASNTVKLKTSTGIEFRLSSDNATGTFAAQDGGGNEIRKLSFKLSDDGRILKATDANGAVVTFVGISHHSTLWELMDQQQRILFSLKYNDDRAVYKLRTPDGATVYKIRVEPYGLKIKNDNEIGLYKVRTEKNKVNLESAADGKTVLSADIHVPPIAVACFGMDILNQDQKAALAYLLTFKRD